MKKAPLKLLITLLMALVVANVFAQTPIWSEEFNGNEINKNVWSHQCGISGFGNGEFQCYTDLPTNSRVEGGNLVMEARREKKDTKNFTSSRLTTLGKFAFQYGSLEARIKLPNVEKGLWPAFWLMGTNIGKIGWPKCGEIDIMEVGAKEGWMNGTTNSLLSGAVHWDAGGQADYGKMKNYPATPFNTAFHTYRLDWTPTSMTMTFDGDKYYEITFNSTMEEFKAPQFILLNLAVGGHNFVQITNEADITATFPGKMEIDYIRLYSNADTKLFSPTEANSYGAPITGDYGVFTENHSCTSKLDLVSDASINVWNGLTASTTTAAEGKDALSFVTENGKWFGLGILGLDKNMSNYTDGTLHFKIKVPSGLTVPIEIGVESTISGGSGNNKVILNATHGLVRDNQWHDINIPLNQIGDIDFTFVKHTFFLSGADPKGAFSIALDDIYWIPSAPHKTPSVGNFAISSETVVTSNPRVVINADARLDIWGGNTLVPSTTTAAEGADAFAFTGGGQGWWGAAISAIAKYDLSAYKYSDCSLKFKVKSTDNASFYVGMKSGNEYYKGVKYITLGNGGGAYDFARNGQWQTITVPLAEFYSTADFSRINGLFVAYGVTNISNIAFDDIYLTNGHSVELPKETSVAVTPSNTTAKTNTALNFTAQVLDQYGNVMAGKTIAWSANGGTINQSGQFTSSAEGTFTITATSGALSGKATATISNSAIIPVVTTVVVSPTSTSITTGVAQIFSAAVKDQNGNTMSGQTVTWTANGGSITQNGSFTSATAGSFTITATVASKMGTASITVTKENNPTSCEIQTTSGDFIVKISSDKVDPTLTFAPNSGASGTPTCMLFYKVSTSTPDWGTVGANTVTPNVPFKITAAEGAKIYFYYVYSMSAGGQQNSVASNDSFVLGSCISNALDNEILNAEVSLYPNPVSSELTIASKGQFNQYQINAFDGSLITIGTLDKSVETQSVDMFNLNSGVYFITLLNDTQKVTRKFIKK